MEGINKDETVRGENVNNKDKSNMGPTWAGSSGQDIVVGNFKGNTSMGA